MKEELTLEQKAKRYDKALKVLHKYDGANIMFTQSLKEELFPELKESEDERIRKWLICYFKEVCDDVSEKEKKGVIAWLERQGEQRPTFGEEDMSKIQRVCKYLDEAKKYYEDIIEVREHMSWIKPFEDKV